MIKSWLHARKLKRYQEELNHYRRKITLPDYSKQPENDIKELEKLGDNIKGAYSKGKINEKEYESLKDETSIVYEKIFRQMIDSLRSNPSDKKVALEQLAQKIEDAYSNERINDKHYHLLSNDILDLKSKFDIN